MISTGIVHPIVIDVPKLLIELPALFILSPNFIILLIESFEFSPGYTIFVLQLGQNLSPFKLKLHLEQNKGVPWSANC